MENASKALIIAGAILVSILLITVGVFIINAVNPVQEQTEKTAQGQAVQMFNAQFTPYEGTEISGSQVKALKNAINSSNASNEEHQVNAGTADATKGLTAWPSIKTRSTYTVELVYDGGYVIGANVTENT